MTNSPRSADGRIFVRLTLNQRMQHWTMMFSFFLLVLTGFPLRFPNSWASSGIVAALGGFTMRGALHRVGAVLLIGVCTYHALYSVLSRRGRQELLAFIPLPKDLFDFIHQMKYYFGLAPTRPRYDRYNYIEKFEYLALGWGSIVMIATGFILWFEDQAMEMLPKWTVDVAKICHSYEAMLAFLAIIIWHFYHVHLNPEVFPMSKVWLTGEMSEHEMIVHHPLEYERLKGRKPDVEHDGGKKVERKPTVEEADDERSSGD